VAKTPGREGGRPLPDQGGQVRHDPDEPAQLFPETLLYEGRGDSGRDGDK